MSLAVTPQSAAEKMGFRWDELRRRVAGRLRIGLRASGRRVGLRRDLSRPFEPPPAKIPITVRPLVPSDVPLLLAPHRDDAMSIANSRRMAAQRPQAAFVAVDDRNGTPCFIQWLFGPADNDYVARLGGFPVLASDEALIDHAYVAPAYRGMGVMPAAMARLAERARDLGAGSVLVFVGDDDASALQRCRRAGFDPHLVHRQDQYVFGLVRRQSFVVMAADDPRRNRTP